MIPNQSDSRYVGSPEWNMAAKSLERMDIIIRAIIVSRLRYDGHIEVAELLRRFYYELSPYLNEPEQTEAEVFLTTIFDDYPIINRSGGGYEIFKMTEDTMNSFELWLMQMLRKKGLLQKFTEDPSEAII